MASDLSITELEIAISRLSAEDLRRFSRWFEEYLADQWDRQIEADVLAGQRAAAGDRALEDFQTGRCTPLH